MPIILAALKPTLQHHHHQWFPPEKFTTLYKALSSETQPDIFAGPPPILYSVPPPTRLTPRFAPPTASSYAVIPATDMTGLNVSEKERGPLVARAGPRIASNIFHAFFFLLVCLRGGGWALEAVDTSDEGRQY